MIHALLLLCAWQGLPPASLPEAGAAARPSITFILGEDEDPALPLFRLAEAHFRRDPGERTDQIVLGRRSLAEVREDLARLHRPGGPPWGVVNLVVHGNATGYVDLPLSAGGPKVSPDALAADLADKGHEALPEAVLDGISEVRLHGCAIGRDPRLLAGLARWFGGEDDQRPRVRGSLWFTAFRPGADPGAGPSRSLCEWWDVYYRAGRLPPVATLKAGALGPAVKAGVAVEEALSRRSPARPGGVYSYEALVRVTWTLVFPADSVPQGIPGGPFARRWLLAQESFQQRLRTAGLAFQQLDWTLGTGEHLVDGRVHPTFRTVGEGRVLHVLRQLARKAGERGPEPQDAWDDPRYYATAR